MILIVPSACTTAFQKLTEIHSMNEAPPHTKTVQHKSHIMKVMFLCALARPRYNNTTRQWFDGLIGIYPVGELDMYKLTSANHKRKQHY
jgi:hypothetical protein